MEVKTSMKNFVRNKCKKTAKEKIVRGNQRRDRRRDKTTLKKHSTEISIFSTNEEQRSKNKTHVPTRSGFCWMLRPVSFVRRAMEAGI